MVVEGGCMDEDNCVVGFSPEVKEECLREEYRGCSCWVSCGRAVEEEDKFVGKE